MYYGEEIVIFPGKFVPPTLRGGGTVPGTGEIRWMENGAAVSSIDPDRPSPGGCAAARKPESRSVLFFLLKVFLFYRDL